MDKILFPLQFQDTGPEVKNLHDAIVALSGRVNLFAFRSLFRQSDFRHSFHIEQAERRYGEATRQVIWAYQETSMKVAPTGQIDEATAKSINALLIQHKLIPAGPEFMKVYGTVYDQWIEPLEGAMVVAFDKEMRSEQPLGEDRTKEYGRYVIHYDTRKLSRADKGAPDILVRLYDKEGQPVKSSSVFYNVTDELRVDINLGPRPYMGPSQFEQALAAIRPLIGETPISELTENDKTQDFTFLLNKTGASPALLVQLVESFYFEKWSGMSAEVFYGILSQGKSTSTAAAHATAIPADVPAAIAQDYINLWTTPLTTMMADLGTAASQNIIAYKVLSREDDIRQKLQKIKLAPPHPEGSKISPPAVYGQIAVAGLNEAQQQVVIENYNPNGLSAGFWKTLAADPAFAGQDGAAAVSKLQVVVQLSSWTGGNTDLAAYILNQEKIQTPDDLVALAGNDATDWGKIITASGKAPAGGAAAVATLAASMATNIEKAWPTPVLSARFAKNAALEIANKDYLGAVLATKDFDIIQSAVPKYLTTYIAKNPLPQGTDQDTVTYQLMGVQRVYKLSGSADQTLTLLGKKIQSARQIYQMGKSNFVGQFGAALGGNDTAERLYDQSEMTHAGAMAITGRLTGLLNNPSKKVFKDYYSTLSNSKLADQHPDLSELFGIDATYCECTDCSSFLSISAYLTDLLDYLHERKALTKPTARALLLANDYTTVDGGQNYKWRRRPDIADIDLNCPNTDTELPYIDIVNELLEDYIIPPIALLKVELTGNDPNLLYAEFLYWLFSYLQPGPINPVLYQLLMKIDSLPTTPICNISLLSTAATVSTVFLTEGENYPAWMMNGEPLIAEWIIRDQYITLKLSLIYLTETAKNLDAAFRNNVIVAGPYGFPAANKNNFNTLSARFPQEYSQRKVLVPVKGNDNVHGYFGIVVQEIHETHLTSAEINANPEYTNTNVYTALASPFGATPWKLYPNAIPQGLPFDLNFAEATTFLEKMGVRRYSLLQTFGQEDPGSLSAVANAYLGLSAGEADIILQPRVAGGAGADPQIAFWGIAIAGQPQVGVDTFLTASGLGFSQLQTLITLTFINPTGNSTIIENIPAGGTVDEACNTANMLLTGLDSAKLDRINRFLRLWNKLNVNPGLSMIELDDCINWLGAGNLDKAFAGQLFYFLQLMQSLGLTATQLLAFYHDIDVNPANNLYQRLFQNRQLTNPLLEAFNWPLSGASPITDSQANPGAAALILTVCGITQDDLDTIVAWGGGTYSLLTLTDLSFIYACGQLAGYLGISVAALIRFAQLTGINPLHQLLPLPTPVANPQSTFLFIQKFNEITQVGCTVDSIDYLLTNQSTATPSLIPDPSAVVDGLTAIRTALQSAITATTVAPDPQGTLLTKWLADTDLGWDKGLAATLLSVLSQTNDALYLKQVRDNIRLLQLLRTQYGQSSASTYLETLPSIAFPDATIANIQFDNANNFLFYNDAMTSSDRDYLLGLPGIDVAGTTAVQNLYAQSQECPIAAVPMGAAAPGWLTANQAAIAQNAPAVSWGKGALGFSGSMSPTVYTILRAQNSDPVYGAALVQLLVSSQGAAAGALTFVQLSNLPVIGLPDAALNSLSYGPDPNNPATVGLSFTGGMSGADCLALLALSNDANYQAAIAALFTTAEPGHTSFVALPALPAGWAGLPDISGIVGFSAGTAPTPALSYLGAMNNFVRDALINLSGSNSWKANIAALFALSQTAGTSGVTLPQPAGINTGQFITYGVQYAAAGANMTLSFTGQLTPAALAGLQALSPDKTYQAALLNLYNQTSALYGATLPAIDIPLPGPGLATVSYQMGNIRFTGAPVLTCNDEFNLTQLGTDPRYQNAIRFIYSNPAIPAGAIGIMLPAMPTISFPTGGAISWQNGVLSYTGQMTVAVQNTLLALSTQTSYQAAIRQLAANSQPGVVTTVSLAALPTADIPAAAQAAGWQFDVTHSVLYFTGAVPISAADAAKLTTGIQTTNPEFAIAVTLLSGLAAVAGSIQLIAPPPATPFAAAGLGLSGGGAISYQGGTMQFTGAMSFADYQGLLALSTDSSWQSAVTSVFLASQGVAAGTVTTSTSYFAIPSITIPSIYAAQIGFSFAANTLAIKGWLETPDLAILQALGSPQYSPGYNYNFQLALNSLYQTVQTANGNIGGPFPAIYSSLTSLTGAPPAPPAPVAHYAYFLNSISANYRILKEMDALTQSIVSIFGVSAAVADVLVNDATRPAAGGTTEYMLYDFIDPAFAGNTKAINPDPTQFTLAQWYDKLDRIAYFVTTFKLSAPATQWLLENGSSINALDLTAWPTAAAPVSFTNWEVWYQLWQFGQQYAPVNVPDPANPETEMLLSVYDIISGALQIAKDIAAGVSPNPGALLASVTQLTGWNSGELNYLLNVDQQAAPGLILNPLKLTDTGIAPIGCTPVLSQIAILKVLSDCFQSAARLKIVASRCVTWLPDPITPTMAADIKQALKSGFADNKSWLTAVQPLMNTLRQERRDALAAYLQANTVSNPFGRFDIFPSEYFLYGNFLIDVEMGACQPTTRTIQGYCSIQLFVQRCLLNFEFPNITVDSGLDADWLQWNWMGTYESWYEARYTFLFPENLILPQTLPGQSSFFQDMQDDLTQGPVTAKLVETAFGNYLQSLDGIARLEIKGMWYDHPGHILYVFARTYGGDPNVYYFRSCNYDTNRWSAWEQIGADISGNEIIPVMQNGRLFLYWPVFKQASDDDKSSQPIPSTSESNQTAPPPKKYWTIQLAFTEYLNGQWTGKKVSTDSLESLSISFPDGKTPYPNTSDFVFLPLDIPDTPGALTNYQNETISLQRSGTVYIVCYYNTGTSKKSGSSGSLLLLTAAVDPKSGNPEVLKAPNSFRLDPLRGYPTAVDITGTVNVQPQIGSANWFGGSEFQDMVLSGILPLKPYFNGTALPRLLGQPAAMPYGVLLSLQMGLFGKVDYIQLGKIDASQMGALMPFFYADSGRTFVVNQQTPFNGTELDYPGVVAAFLATQGDLTNLLNFYYQIGAPSVESGPIYQFLNFYHPFTHQFIRIFAQYGAKALLSRAIQLTGDKTYGNTAAVQGNLIIENNPAWQSFDFAATYSPSGEVYPDENGNYPLEQIDFDIDSGYGQYNWELFYHAILLSAMQLSQNQQFEEANNWLKLIFDPTDSSGYNPPEKYWVTKRFFEFNNSTVSIDDLILSELDPASQPAFWNSVKLWRNDPYDPHMLAQNRITPYMMTAFMKTLDNLIAWANYNYQQYTMESVNIAIQLYLYALEILGPKPVAIPPIVQTPVCNYYQFELELDIIGAIDQEDGYLSDPIVLFENILPPASSSGAAATFVRPGASDQKLPLLRGLYFCIPPNPVLMAYWDTIEKDLTQIRNCQNIKGQFQPLSPFPNVPGAGFPDDSGIGDFGGVLPNYRFRFMIQKAVEFAGEVRTLGAALLSALEKQDAEDLAQIRAKQEIAVQNNIDAIKQFQITDAELGKQNLQNYQTLIQDKINYYSGLVQNGLIPLEQQALTLNQFSLALQGPIAAESTLASILKLLPNFDLGLSGFGGSPTVTASIGGSQFGGAVDTFVQILSFVSQFADKSAAIANTNAGYSRRNAEWTFQLGQANDELAQVQTQIQAADNRIKQAQRDEKNQQDLISNAEKVSDFLTTKYTSKQLYTWMVTQIANVYFQSYQLAYNFAKQTEVCFGYELGITGSSYISYGYWDTLNKGLLSGEGLIGSLRKMESDYYNLNIREYEITRQISLAQLDPMALLQLKATGQCFIDLPEALFDLDYPGHYFRRIKHVALTLPGIVGQYTPVNLKLTLLANSVRINNTAGTAKNYPRNTDSTGAPTNDSRFLDSVAAVQYIATSTAVNDNGLFEKNLNDERYLPFERAGVISSWKVELPSVYPQFDWSTISDLILHVSYTSRDGGAALQTVAAQSVQNNLKIALAGSGLVLVRGFSARRDFPTGWYKFLHPVNPGDAQELDLDLSGRLPYFVQGLKVKISSVTMVANVPDGGKSPVLYLSGTRLANSPLNFGSDDRFGSMLYSVTHCNDAPGVWKVTNGTKPNVTPITDADINDLYVFFYYVVQN